MERIKERNRLRQIAKRTNKTSDWENWKIVKNKVNNLLRTETRNKTRREQELAKKT